MAAYFNAQLIKTADLDPQGRYIFAAYPHGITAISGWICFATEACGFSRIFPGPRLTLHASPFLERQAGADASTLLNIVTGHYLVLVWLLMFQLHGCLIQTGTAFFG
jgi:hypothetical protein